MENYSEWTKESIDKIVKDKDLLLLDNYIQWYKNNKNTEKSNNLNNLNNFNKMYSLDNLQHVYCIIHNDKYKEENHSDYIEILHYSDNCDNCDIFNYSSLIYGIIIFTVFFLLKYIIMSFFTKEEKKYTYEIKIPFSNDIINQLLENIHSSIR